MKPLKACCRYCKLPTAQCCPECRIACCLACGTNLCPICVRVKLLQIERALTERLVPWQYVEVAMVPVRRRYAMRLEYGDVENSDQPGYLPV